MRRPSIPLLAILLLLAVSACIMWLGRKLEVSTANPSTGTVNRETAPAEEDKSEAVAAATGTEAPAVQTAADNSLTDPARYRRAYLLALDGDRLSLENTQDIEGDFRTRRGQRREWTGMLRCRLISENGTVLAEELVPAPDHLCTVLDERDGTPNPVSFTAPGPVMFQLRLPRVANATRLEVARITGSGALARDQPVGSLNLAAH